MDKTKIIFVNIPSSGGLAHYSNDFCNALVNNGFEVDLITIDKFQVPSKYRIFNIFEPNSKFSKTKNFRSYKYLKIYIKIFYLYQVKKYDYVFINAYQTPLDYFLHFFISTKIICIQHEINSRITGKTNYFQKKFYHSLDSLIIHKYSDQYDELVNRYSILPSKIIEINHGFYRAKLFGSANELVSTHILFFGTIRRDKAIDILIQSYDGPISNNGLSLQIIGKVNDFEYGELIKSLIKKHSFSKDIIFLPKFIKDNELRKYFSGAKFLVLPFYKCRQSGTLRMAIYFEKPVIVTNTGELSYIVNFYKIGLVVPIDNVKELKHAIEKLANNDMLYNECKKNIKNLKKNKDFDWDYIIKGLKKVI